MKLGFVGKGGTGKTTIAALVARGYASQGRCVLAIDTDSDPNLALMLGLDSNEAERVPVLPRTLVVGSGGGAVAASDLLRDHGVFTPSGVTVLQASAVTEAAAGCACTAHSSVRSLLAAAIEQEAEVTVVDMEAGLEHLSRSGGTLAYTEVLLVVMEPSVKSVIAGGHARRLAEELGIPRIFGVGNKARLPEDTEFFAAASARSGVAMAAVVPYDPQIIQADRAGSPLVAPPGTPIGDGIGQILQLLDSLDEADGLRWKLDRVADRLQQLQTS